MYAGNKFKEPIVHKKAINKDFFCPLGRQEK